VIATWFPPLPGATVHGLSISDDGNRGYVTSLGGTAFSGTPTTALTDPSFPPNNGLQIYDTSEIQERKASPKVKLIGSLMWKDGSAAQHTIPIKIKGKPYVVFVDELGPGGEASSPYLRTCALGVIPFSLARIIDVSDEKNPRVISKLMHEVHDPANCDKVLPDIPVGGGFVYGSHYCSVDNRHKATTLACGYFNSGIRVFDIRDPVRPREIAYYNPAGVTTPTPGSNPATFVPGLPTGAPRRCISMRTLGRCGRRALTMACS